MLETRNILTGASEFAESLGGAQLVRPKMNYTPILHSSVDTLIKSGPGLFYGWVLLDAFAGTTPPTLTLYDSLTAAGQRLTGAGITFPAADKLLAHPIPFVNGLFYDNVAAAVAGTAGQILLLWS